MLAEIIISTRVGREHVRLAAGLVIADDELTEAVSARGEPTNEGWLDALEGLLDRVERYQDAWVMLESIERVVEGREITSEGRGALDNLAVAMRATIEAYRSVAARLCDFGNPSDFGAT